MKKYLLRLMALLLMSVLFSSQANHPVFMSVTEIEHNSKENILEITCKIFTNDFESQLKKNATEKVELLNPALKLKMNKKVEDYLQVHLKISVNDKAYGKIKFIGFEQVEDAIVSYFEMEGIEKVNKLAVWNDILYEYSNQQINLIHVTVKGERKSRRLDYPQTKSLFDF